MSFLNPSYIWALFGLAIPLAIHLWSKKEGKTIKIGSIQLLSEADSKQSSSIKINELLLLLLRMLCFALIVFIVAEPQIKSKIRNTSITYIVEPSLANNAAITTLLDTLTTQSPILLLRKGFPEFTNEALETSENMLPNYWQLAQEMETLRTDSIIVFTQGLISGLKGKRPQIQKNIEWIFLESGEPSQQIVEIQAKETTVELISLESDFQHTSFNKESLQTTSDKLVFNTYKDSLRILENGQQVWHPVKTNDSLKVAVFFDNSFSEQAIYIEAAYNAISNYIERPIEVEKITANTALKTNEYKTIVWLSENEPIQSNVNILVYKPDPLARSLVTKGASVNERYLTQLLTAENVTKEHLPEQLMKLLDLHAGLDEKVKTYDKRVSAKTELLPIQQVGKTKKSDIHVFSIVHWLWGFLLLSLVSERIISNFRKQ